ncbi:MAG: Holliday junction branch migration DNA helicase RuvB [Mycoplasmataceae bacterium]|jgi:Holliday junction DNA helicase RuvB|nr:Holliday junction branch migration DNA helicase RuvB [Mycoplasmataceae bacterium]
MSINLRPSRLSEFKGKEDIKKNINIFILACKKQNTIFDHCIIYGLPGTGKTSLAMIIANELGRKIKIIQGACIQKNVDVINIVLTLNEGDIIFIDEIHAINSQCIELLYTIMEEFMLDITLGRDLNAKISRIPIPKFTLIGATTKMGLLPLPFEERFGISINLKIYKVEEIVEILRVNAQKLNLVLSEDDLLVIAKNSKNIPRNANRLIKRVADFRCVDSKYTIKQIFKHLKIYEDGLEQDDVLYLKAVSKSDKSIGLKTISMVTNIDIITVENKIEPYLITQEYVQKTNSGRIITEKGKKFIHDLTDSHF